MVVRSGVRNFEVEFIVYTLELRAEFCSKHWNCEQNFGVNIGVYRSELSADFRSSIAEWGAEFRSKWQSLSEDNKVKVMERK